MQHQAMLMSSGASVSAKHAAYHNIAVVRFVLLLSTFNYVTLQFPLIQNCSCLGKNCLGLHYLCL